jgi:hypothetical protein
MLGWLTYAMPWRRFDGFSHEQLHESFTFEQVYCVVHVAGDFRLFYGTCLVRMVTMYLVAHKPLGLQILKLCKVVLLPNTMFLDVRLVLVCM